MSYVEQYADAYVRALDRADFDAVGMILTEAMGDPELDRVLTEVDAELHSQAGLGKKGDE